VASALTLFTTAGILRTTAQSAPPADVVPFAGLSPDDAAKHATLPPGFQMHVFAAEPDVVQPIAFCLDHRGRVWVAEGMTYPRRRGHPPKEEREAGADRSRPTPGQLADIFGGVDRILVFEDTDGDHRFDRKTVFLDQVNLVSGLEVGFGGVWIGAAPYVLFIPMVDGDAPKPAGDPRILLDGWNYTADTHETLNTFTWGPDGWLYGCHGVFCPSNVGKPGASNAERQWMDAGVWRYHPTRHVFEVFTEGGSNPWGIDFNEYGELFAEMCVIPHFFHMIQGARIQRQGGEHFAVGPFENRLYGRPEGKPVHPHIYHDIPQHGDHVHWAGNAGPHAANARSDQVGGGHAHAGILCYLGESWPAEYRGSMLIGNIHGQRLNLDVPERLGSGYVGRHGKDFLNFNDTWSQTLNQRYDQDGSLYVIDWYDKNQCHHNREDGHDRGNGRIFKVVYQNQKVSPVNLAALSDSALADLVPSRNEFLSRVARQELQHRAATKPPSAGWAPWTSLDRLLQDSAASVPARLRALWGLHLTGGLSEQRALELAEDREDYLRAWAVQLACEREVSAGWLAQLPRLAAQDPSPLVRRFVASAIQRVQPANRLATITALLKHKEDATDHNLPLMAWFAMEPLIAERSNDMLSAAFSTQQPRILEFTARRVALLNTDAARDAVTATLARARDARRRIEILQGLEAALRGVRQLPMPKGWDAIETSIGTSSDIGSRMLVLQLSLIFGSPTASAALRSTLTDAGAPDFARRTALEALTAAKDVGIPALLRQLLADPPMRGAALRGLAAINDPQTPVAILAIYPSLDPAQKRDALTTLTSRPAFAKPMLDAVASDKVPRADLTADLIRQLRNVKDDQVQQQVGKLYGAVRELDADRRAAIEKYRRLYWSGGSQPGDAPSGRVVYNRVCAQCHTLFDSGGKVGPDITGANRFDLDYLLETVLDPNSVIPNEYRSTEIELKDGRSLTGIVKSQSDQAITFQTANELLTLSPDEIDSRRQTELSMMPEGLLEPLQDQEIRDLIYYLTRVGQVPLPPDHPADPVPLPATTR
jgi:putative membrane-bound dehydrogenase-like protein